MKIIFKFKNNKNGQLRIPRSVRDPIREHDE